ncbi:MAG TPA: glycosyltransferase [Candidatus Limnocylindrales bacterium]|nr:glycosyltransferase [Candidatus Limnocylindrales bacterium]
MKVAIVHDYIKEYGGAERVLETLLEIYPDADVFTSLYAPEFLGPHKARFEKYNIKTTFLNSIPFRHKLISPLRLLSTIAFSSLDLSSYDVVIVSQTGAYFPNLIKKKSALQICYTHTPPRYLYGYATARDWKKHKIIAAVAQVANHFLRMTDFNSSKNVDYFIANSDEVAARIKKFYRRDATVIYPPVDISNQQSAISNHEDKNYYLTGGRLARAKGIDVIVKAFNSNGLTLKIFGKGFAGYEEELKEIANKNIEFVGEVSDSEKLELMRNAKAFMFTSHDEDFGITPVEAMGMGTPVLAYKSGGVKETVVDGKTGLFFDENTPEKLNDVIKKFEKMKISPDECIKQAKKFSKERFKKNIQEFVKSKIKI